MTAYHNHFANNERPIALMIDHVTPVEKIDNESIFCEILSFSKNSLCLHG